jgi:hypothetical protein
VLFESAQRYAVGNTGAYDFLWFGPRWEAAGGWALVVAISLAGAALLTTLVLADSRPTTVRLAWRR